jgi:hypothetical protein
MKGDKPKNISLPDNIIKVLATLANKERLPVKQYMEKVLIEHVKGKK